MQHDYQRSSHYVLAVLFLFWALMFFGACEARKDGKEPVPETPTEMLTPTEAPMLTEMPTPTVKPRNWLNELLEEGRTELSREYDGLYREEGFFKLPVMASKTVRLGDFEYTMTVPQTIFRLEELQNGTVAFETTSILRYVGEKESVHISHGDIPFTGCIADPSGNIDGGGGYSLEAYSVLQKGEEISFTKRYDKFSKGVNSTGTGGIVTIVEFSVLDENDKDTGEHFGYLLAIPFDILE